MTKQIFLKENYEERIRRKKRKKRIIMKNLLIIDILVLIIVTVMFLWLFFDSSKIYVHTEREPYNVYIMNRSSHYVSSGEIEFYTNDGRKEEIYFSDLQPKTERKYFLQLFYEITKYSIIRVTNWGVINKISLALALSALIILIFARRYLKSEKYMVIPLQVSDAFFESKSIITGILVNNINKEFSNIKIIFAIYDSDDNQIGITTADISNIQPYKKAVFKKSLEENYTKMGPASIELIDIKVV